MIKKKLHIYRNPIRYSTRFHNPVGVNVNTYQCTTLYVEDPLKFERALRFLRRHNTWYKDHPKRPEFSGIGGFGKITVNIPKKVIYLSKHLHSKRHNILVGDML